MSNTVITFTMRDLEGVVVPNTLFQIVSGRPNTGVIPTEIPVRIEFETDENGEATVTLVSSEAVPYFISKVDGSTESVISYKFFVPQSEFPLASEMLYVDLGPRMRQYNDKSIAALIEAKVVAVNAKNQVQLYLASHATIHASITAMQAEVKATSDAYLGSKSTPPTVRKDGSPLVPGDQYYSTASNGVFIWNSLTWIPFGSGGSAEYSTHTATAGQTVFTVPTQPASNNAVDVFINGITQARTTFTVSSTTVTLSTGANAGDTVEVRVATLSTAGAVAKHSEELVAVLNQTNYTTTKPMDALGSSVFLDGAYQHRSTYNIVGENSLQFSEAPPAGTKIEIVTVGSTSYTGGVDLLKTQLAASNGASLVGFGEATLADLIQTQHSSVVYGVATASDAIQNTVAISNGMVEAASDHSSSMQLKAGKYDTNNLTLPINGGLIGIDSPRQGQPGNWINGTAKTDAGSQLWTEDVNGATNLIAMQMGSQVKNVNFWYPSQTKADSWASVVAYPTTIKVGTVNGVNADNAVVKNVSALNAYNFMDIGDGVNSVGRTVVEDVFTNAFNRGFLIRSKDGDLPYLNRCAVQNLFTTDQVNRPVLNEHIRQNGVAYEFGYAQGANMTDCIALGYGYGLKVTDQTWAQITNCLFDYCGTPFTATGADRVMLNNCTFLNNYKIGGPSAVVSGVVKGLSFSNCTFGDYYTTIKTGVFSSHSSGTVKVSSAEFKNKFPAVLNTGSGLVDVSASGIGYADVTGQGISIDGGPRLKAGEQLPLASINPTVPANAAWSFTTAGNVSSIAGGIRIQGAGNNTITWRPGNYSAGENNTIFFGTQIYCLEFDYFVSGQAGSPRMELLVLNDSLGVAADAFQICNDVATNPSGLPEGQAFHVSLILPWAGDASQLRFNLPNQLATTEHRITNMKVSQVALPRGATGLEWFGGKTKLPLGYYDAHTGGKVFRFPAAPSAGTWSAGDKVIQLTPTVGQPKGWICTVGGAPGTWVSEGNL